MMTDRFILLLEKYFDEGLNKDEKQEFEHLINSDDKYKKEFEEQKRVKEVLSKMKMKNPSNEVWDSYWLGVYNQIERGLAWIIISIGAILLLGYGAVHMVENFFEDTQTPPVIKYGAAAVAVGFVILIISILREKLYTGTKDKYKEIQR